jgi:Fe(3+) dicitrate transport protein
LLKTIVDFTYQSRKGGVDAMGRFRNRLLPFASLPLPLLALLARPAHALPNAPTEPPTASPAAAVTEGSSKPEEVPPSKPEEPETLQVQGSRTAQTSGSVHVVNEKQLKRFNYDNPEQVLLQVPGVYVRGEDGVGLRPNIGMRGGNSDRSKKLTLTEDGILFGPAPYAAPAAYYFPLIGRMRGVRVTKGPSSIVNGPQTVAGAIDLMTHDVPATHTGYLDTAFGQYGFRRLSLGVGSGDEKAGFWIEAEQLANTGFKTIDLVGGDTGAVRNEAMAKGRWVLDPDAKIQQVFGLKLGYSEERSNETYTGLTDADFRATPFRRYFSTQFDQMNFHRTQVEGSYAVQFSKHFSLTTTAYRHDLDRTWRKLNRLDQASVADVLADPTSSANRRAYGILTGANDSAGAIDTLWIGPNRRTFISEGVQTVVKYDGKTGPVSHKVEYGLRLHYDQIVRLHSEDGFFVKNKSLVSNGLPTVVTADNTDSAAALASYATDTIDIGRFQFTPGVRIEMIHGKSVDRLAGTTVSALQKVLIPGIGVYGAAVKSKKQELGFLAGIHKGFSPAPPGDAKPEESWNVEAGSRYTTRHVRAEVLGFLNEYSNLINICAPENGCVNQTERSSSAGSARVYGVEAYVEGEMPLRLGSTPRAPRGDDSAHQAPPSLKLAIPFRASYTYTHTAFLSEFESSDPQFGKVFAGYEMPYVPRHQFAASTGLEGERFGINLGATYVGKSRELAGDGAYDPTNTTDSYLLVDASARLTIAKGLSVYINGRNLGDEHYLVSRRPFGARPGAPRWVQAGAKYMF